MHVQLPELFNSSEDFDRWFGSQMAGSGVPVADGEDGAACASKLLHAEQVRTVCTAWAIEGGLLWVCNA